MVESYSRKPKSRSSVHISLTDSLSFAFVFETECFNLS